MKFKYVNKERILILCLLLALVTVSVFSQDTYFMPGVQAPHSFTIYKENSVYYSKNDRGLVEYSGSNFSEVILDSANGLSSQGGKIFLKAEKYYADTTLTFPSSKQIIVRGEGHSVAWAGGVIPSIWDQGTTIIASASLTALVNITGTTWSNPAMVTLEDLTINGANQVTYGVYIDRMFRRKAMESVTIANCTTGLYMTYAWINDFYSLQVEQCTTGIQLEWVTDGAIGNNFFGGRIEGCEIGIYIKKKADDNVFWGMRIEGCSVNHVKLERSGDTTIGIPHQNKWINCYFEEANKNSSYVSILITTDGTPTTGGGVYNTEFVGCSWTTNNDWTVFHLVSGVNTVITQNMICSGAGTCYITINTHAGNNYNSLNQIYGNVRVGTWVITDNGYDNFIHDNGGAWRTEAWGTATGSSPITVDHGLEAQVNYVVLGLVGSATHDLSWDNVNATHFNIYHDAGGSVSISWRARYDP